MAKLTRTQEDVLAKMREHGGKLVRLTGGFWTWPDCPGKIAHNVRVPDWWCGTQTVATLLRKGLVQRAGAPDRTMGTTAVTLTPEAAPGGQGPSGKTQAIGCNPPDTPNREPRK